MLRFITTALGALICGFAGAWLFSLSGLGGTQTERWLLDHPEILPKVAQKLQENENRQRLAGIRGDLVKPFPGAVMGNPNGKIVLTEFTDYACTYCRQSVPDIRALIASNPELKVVVREWPIFEGSDVAARMALAAARQGKYTQFHDAMFLHAPPTQASIARAAQDAGLDLAAAQTFAASPEVELELRTNHELASRLGFEGTPSWVIGNQAFSGAVGRDRLAQAIAQSDPGA